MSLPVMLLASALAFARRAGRPSVLGGDVNMSPEQLRDSGILEQMDLYIVFPPGQTISCTSGNGKLIDFCLVSRFLSEAILQCFQDTASPWKPHTTAVLRTC